MSEKLDTRLATSKVSDERENIAAASISAADPREYIQRAISENPGLLTEAKPGNIAAAHANPIEKKLPLIPIEEKLAPPTSTGQARRPDTYLLIEDKKEDDKLEKRNTPTQNFVNSLICLKDGFSQIFSKPIEALKASLTKTYEASGNLASRFLQAILEIPKNLFSAAEKLADTIKDIIKSNENAKVEDKTTRITAEKPTNFNSLDKQNEQLAESKKPEASELASTKILIEESEDQGSYIKSAAKLLLDSIQTIAEALQNKNEKKKEELEQFELTERTEKLAIKAEEKLAQAENLRPDLADEIDLPDMSFMHDRVFSGIPNAGILIAQAESRKTRRSAS